MKLKDFLTTIEALGLDPETEVVVQTSQATYETFLIEVGRFEYIDGGVAPEPDDDGDGSMTTHPLPEPILAIEAILGEPRKASTF